MNLYKEYKEEKIEEQCKKRDQEILSKDTVIIYEQTKSQDFIIRVFKISSLTLLLLGLMGSLVLLFSTM